MKKVELSEEVIYVTPKVSFLNLSVESPILGSSNEGIDDGGDI